MSSRTNSTPCSNQSPRSRSSCYFVCPLPLVCAWRVLMLDYVTTLCRAGFKGQGHRLGTAEPTQPQPQAQPAQASSSSQQRATLQQPQAAHHVRKVEPRQELKPATEFSPFTAVIGEYNKTSDSQWLLCRPVAAASPDMISLH